MPPISHLIYIPSVLLIGIVFGFILGGRAARDAQAVTERAGEERARRRAARETARAAADKPPGNNTGP